MSPMAHFAVAFLALGLLVLIPALPVWTAVLLLVPIAASLALVRLRTVADRNSVTAHTLLGSRTARWDDIEGLRFTKSAWARAHLRGGSQMVLPAVTFATVPILAAASGGQVPNPYDRPD